MPKSYWQSQLDRIQEDAAIIRVRFRSEHESRGLDKDANTNWLSLTPAQFEQVKGFLLSIEEGLI